jgi:hypothetical protein
MKQHAKFEKLSPLRRPDWRWQRVLDLVLHGRRPRRCTSRDDRWVGIGREFVIRWTRGGERTRDELYATNPGLVHAYDLFEHGCAGPAYPAVFVEARLLAGQSCELIAKEHSTIPETIQFYEALFFNVAEHLQERDWIIANVILPRNIVQSEVLRAQRHRRNAIPVALPFNDALLRYCCYAGGPAVVDVMIHGFQSGHLKDAHDLSRWLDKNCALTVQRRALLAASLVEINSTNAMRLLAENARIRQIDYIQHAPDNLQSKLEQHIKALIDDIPWRLKGTKPLSAMSEKERLLHGLPGELRDDEIGMTIDELPLDELRMELPPPRSRQANPPASDDQSDFLEG